MITHYETIAIPEIADASIPDYLDQLARLKIPGFIVRSAGNSVLGHIAERAESIDDPVPLEDSSFGWHVDFTPSAAEGLIIVDHKTVDGEVQAELLVPKPAMWQLPVKYSILAGLPRPVAEPLWRGEVDDTFVETTVHIGRLSAEDELVFASSGPAPLLHRFTNVRSPRKSWARAARIPLLAIS